MGRGSVSTGSIRPERDSATRPHSVTVGHAEGLRHEPHPQHDGRPRAEPAGVVGLPRHFEHRYIGSEGADVKVGKAGGRPPEGVGRRQDRVRTWGAPPRDRAVQRARKPWMKPQWAQMKACATASCHSGCMPEGLAVWMRVRLRWNCSREQWRHCRCRPSTSIRVGSSDRGFMARSGGILCLDNPAKPTDQWK